MIVDLVGGTQKSTNSADFSFEGDVFVGAMSSM